MKAETMVNIQPIFNMLSNVEQARQAAADELLLIADPYVPYRSGDLSSDGVVHSSIGLTYIEWNRLYANYVYQGELMAGKKPKHATGEQLTYGIKQHPLAGPQWDQRAINDHPNALENVVVEALLHGN